MGRRTWDSYFRHKRRHPKKLLTGKKGFWGGQSIVTSYLRFFFMLPYEFRYILHEIHNKSKMVSHVNFLIDLKLTSCNADKVLRETHAHQIRVRPCSWCLTLSCVELQDGKSGKSVLYVEGAMKIHHGQWHHFTCMHAKATSNSLQQHYHINTCSNARPQFWELLNSAPYYPNI